MDKALKQRLVGASVLVALAVIVLPMLLGGGSDPQTDSRPIDLPPKPRELAFDTRRFPVGDQDPESPSVLQPAPEAAAPVPAEEEALPAVNESGDVPAEAPVPEGDAVPAVETTEPLSLEAGPADGEGEGTGDTPTQEEPDAPVPAVTPAPTGRYLVQVASFSSTANADRLSEQLRRAGLPVIRDTVDATAGILHRVRVGPYDDQAAADAAVARVRAEASDINPRVIDLRPDESAPVSRPSDPLVRWVVQVGSFGEPGNAEELVFQLRDAGFPASSVRVDGTGGTAHKVQVGPVAERQDAVQLAERIKAELDIDGLVMSAE